MVNGRRKAEWARFSSLFAVICTAHGAKDVTPEMFDPTVKGNRLKRPGWSSLNKRNFHKLGRALGHEEKQA
jgi:hypothetical protein